jgi:hypothetical protein
MLKRVVTFVEVRLQIVHSPESMPDASTQAQNREDNKRFLFALCFAGVHPGRYRDMLEKNADQLLDDVGGLPWGQDATAMKLLCTSAACAGHGHDEPCQCGDEHRFRVATHIKVLFFRRQPMLAAQSRWTGIPNAAAWFVGEKWEMAGSGDGGTGGANVLVIKGQPQQTLDSSDVLRQLFAQRAFPHTTTRWTVLRSDRCTSFLFLLQGSGLVDSIDSLVAV